MSASETPSDGLCDSEPKSQPVKAAIWIIGAMASFTSMAIAGREVSVELDTFELMLFRSLIGIVIVVSIGAWSGRLGQVRTKRIGLHIVRNIFHFAGQNLWFYAVALIPFAQLFALEFTVPLWVALLAPFVLAERMTAARVLAALIGFAGILLIVRPDAMALSPGIIAAGLCAIGFAGSVIGTKILSRTETTLSILFWLTIIQAGLGVVFASLDGGISLPSSSALPWIVLVGCAGLLAHFCLTNALRLAPATIVAPLDFARLPIIAVIGLVFYNEPLSLFVFAGAILVFGANFLNIWSEQRRIG
ncbi:MAG: DMT family transporter [Alphaproteobacteria bacterium]